MRCAAPGWENSADVGPCRENAGTTPQHDRPGRVRDQLVDGVAQLPQECHRQRVHLGPLERDERHAVAAPVDATTPSWPMTTQRRRRPCAHRTRPRPRRRAIDGSAGAAQCRPGGPSGRRPASSRRARGVVGVEAGARPPSCASRANSPAVQSRSTSLWMRAATTTRNSRSRPRRARRRETRRPRPRCRSWHADLLPQRVHTVAGGGEVSTTGGRQSPQAVSRASARGRGASLGPRAGRPC